MVTNWPDDASNFTLLITDSFFQHLGLSKRIGQCREDVLVPLAVELHDWYRLAWPDGLISLGGATNKVQDVWATGHFEKRHMDLLHCAGVARDYGDSVLSIQFQVLAGVGRLCIPFAITLIGFARKVLTKDGVKYFSELRTNALNFKTCVDKCGIPAKEIFEPGLSGIRGPEHLTMLDSMGIDVEQVIQDSALVVGKIRENFQAAVFKLIETVDESIPESWIAHETDILNHPEIIEALILNPKYRELYETNEILEEHLAIAKLVAKDGAGPFLDGPVLAKASNAKKIANSTLLYSYTLLMVCDKIPSEVSPVARGTATAALNKELKEKHFVPCVQVANRLTELAKGTVVERMDFEAKSQERVEQQKKAEAERMAAQEAALSGVLQASVSTGSGPGGPGLDGPRPAGSGRARPGLAGPDLGAAMRSWEREPCKSRLAMTNYRS